MKPNLDVVKHNEKIFIVKWHQIVRNIALSCVISCSSEHIYFTREVPDVYDKQDSLTKSAAHIRAHLFNIYIDRSIWIYKRLSEMVAIVKLDCGLNPENINRCQR